MSDAYAKAECALCHKIVPKNLARSVTIERESGRSSGSARFYGKSAAWSTGRTYYRKQTVWVCEECYPKFIADQFRQTLTTGAVWLGVIVGGVWLFSGHGAQVSDHRPDVDTTASITKQKLVQPTTTPTAASYALAPSGADNLHAPRAPQPKSPVQEVQNLLIKLGYDVGPADGKMGPKTKSALNRFAAVEHLNFDGRISGQILTTLRARAKETEETLATLRGQGKDQ